MSAQPERVESPSTARAVRGMNLLPPELLLAILDHLRKDTSTLLSCALVSPLWTTLTHPLLLKRVTLSPDLGRLNGLLAAVQLGGRWICETLEFSLDLLGHAVKLGEEAWGVEGVVVDCESWCETGYDLGPFFALDALNDLSRLEFRSGRVKPQISLSHLPRHLSSLHLGRFWPDELGRQQLVALLTASRLTLRRLVVEGGDDEQSLHGVRLAQEEVGSGVEELALILGRSCAEGARAVQSFGSLQRLKVESSRVQVIVELVTALGSGIGLREVTLVFVECALGDRVEDLLACISAPALAGVKRLTIMGGYLDSLRKRGMDDKLERAAERNRIGRLTFERHLATNDGR